MSKETKQTIYVGKSPINNYIVALMKVFKKSKEALVVARGRNIGTSVVLADLATRTFDKVAIKDVKIGNEEVEFEREGTKVQKTLTNITICLEKQL